MKAHFYYIEIPHCSETARRLLIKSLSVKDWGIGTACDKSASWLEIRSECDSIVEVRDELSKLLHNHIHRLNAIAVVPITKGEGKAQSRQQGLFGGRQD